MAISPVPLADYDWLVSQDTARWLDLASAVAKPTPALAAQLRDELSAERTHLVLEQAALRRRAAEKFTLARRMFFSPVGLEQATDEWIAKYKAARFPPNVPLADLCCGIGGDLLALAGGGPTIGIDRDPITTVLAKANLAVWTNAGRPPRQAEFQTADVAQFDLSACAAWHLDPDRRPAGRRTTRVVAHDPAAEVIERLLATCPNAAIKLAPAAVLPDGWSRRAELEWISRTRECRQLVAWFGELTVSSGSRRATMLDGDGAVRRTIRGEPDSPIPHAPRIGRFVFEPDAAVLAAKLTGALAGEHGLAAVTPGIAYLTGDTPLDEAALACFEVLDLLPLRIRALKSWLRQRSIGRLEIKKRGVDLDPAQLRRQLRVAGDTSAALLVTRLAGRDTVIAARRTPQPAWRP
ncbi:MAG TPA: class I SAM-dependent methyltransferase, partial [Pirellulales bacterium]|nr:class I SAM-dependent methyltransferase [Pirellulales bacterium]